MPLQLSDFRQEINNTEINIGKLCYFLIIQSFFLLVFKVCNVILFHILLIFQLWFLCINLADIIVFITKNNRELLDGLSSLIILFCILKSISIHLWFFSELNSFIHSHSKRLKLHQCRSFDILVRWSLFLAVLKLEVPSWILSHGCYESFRFIWLIWVEARCVKSFN
jgi:hypothetical protein